MKYLCLIYHDEECIDAMDGGEFEAVLAGMREYDDDLRESGHSLASAPLQPAHTATTIRVRNGRIVMTDGPAIDSKQQLGGVYLIDASDLNDAIRLVARMPSARIGSVEVRPVRQVDGAGNQQKHESGSARR